MNTVDVLVVGSGAGGAVAAWALARRGVRVRLLETGPRFDPKRYDTHEQDWELRFSEFDTVSAQPGHQSYESADGEPLDPDYAHLTSRTPTTFSHVPRSHRRPLVYSRAIGLGGSTLHYQGEAHRFPAQAFRLRSERGVAVDWPFGYDALAPYYERVEKLLGVAGDPDNPWKATRGPYPYPSHPLSQASLHVGRAARGLGWTQLPNPLAVLPAQRGVRAACHYCNGCTRGCKVGAKGSVDIAVLPEAEATGNLEIETGFHVTRLDFDSAGRVTGVLGFDASGTEQRHRAKAVVLAAGAIETPRLLLNSVGSAHPDGLGNAEGQVGRNLMEYLYCKRSILCDRRFESSGLPIDSRIWDFSAGSDELPCGFVLGQEVSSFEGPAGFAWEGVSGFGRRHRAGMRRFGTGIELMGVAEQLPRSENRVRLSENADRFGLPLARIETRLGRLDLEVLSQVHGRLGELVEAIDGAEQVGQYSAYDAPYATHVAGTCRMGTQPRDSVTDSNGAVHGHRNLVVADASALVTQGAGDSPSLTIQALALRAAERLADRMRQRNDA